MTSTVVAPDVDTRQAVCFLNYPRDVVDAIAAMINDGTAAFGPSTMGEGLWPVDAVYDPATNRTRVGLSYIRPRAVVRACRVCGCTDDRACRPTCWWTESDLCSACTPPP